MFTNFVRWMDRANVDLGIVAYSLLFALMAFIFGMSHMFDDVIFLCIIHTIIWFVPTMILAFDAFIKHGFKWVTDGEIVKEDFIFNCFTTHIVNDKMFTLIAIFGAFALVVDAIVVIFTFPVVLIPLAIAGFIVLIMYLARMVWRIKSKLTNHVNDLDAHTKTTFKNGE